MRIFTAIAFGLVASCHAAAPAPVVTPVPAVAPGPVAPGRVADPAVSEPIPLGPLPADAWPVREALHLQIDPEADHFTGTADIAIHLGQPRRQIWLHGRGLTVAKVELATATGTLVARWDEVDPTGVVRVALPAAVAGDVTLHVEYRAAYDPQLVGVYRVKTRSGPAVFSKFEAIYARRAFPSFDEPRFKIPYQLTIDAPAGAVVIGNLPIDHETVHGAHKTVQLGTTPALPSYLVAFAVGPFETRTTTLAASPDRATPLVIGAVAITGRGADTAYALAQEPALLAEQERYFGVGFPFPKLDLVAVPDFQSGAMENAGAITFRDSNLLIDDRAAPLEQRIAVAGVLAHETAHQWFGDLVTMTWWDDLWLNEGFATFLASRTLQAVRPDVEAELATVNRVATVMRVDGLASARRIRQPIETAHDITNAFDGITYDKGAAVLTMLAHFVGDEPFRRGLHAFLTAHARGNATTGELIAALSAAAGQDLAPLVGSFIDQPGVPVVAMQPRCAAGAGTVELSQARWRSAGAAAGEGDPLWTIPVCVRAGIGKRVEQACTLLGSRTGTLALPGCADWVLPNAQAAGYYHATLPAGDLARLRDRGMARLSAAERVQLGHDLEAAFASAALAGDDVLRALEPFARDPHGAVAVVPLTLWQDLGNYFVDAGQRGALRARVARLYAPALASVGWQPAANDVPWRRLLRSQLLGFLALDVEDPAVLGEAARRGRRLLGLDRDRVAHPDAVAPDLAGLALAAAVRTGGADVFDAVAGVLARSDDAQARARTLSALAAARDPARMARALDLALDPGLRGNERLTVLRALLGAVATRDVAWAWLVAHFDALMPLLPDRAAGAIPSMIALCDPVHAAEVRAFFAPRVEALTGGPRHLAQALETAAQCAARVAAQRGHVAAYLH